jgi:glucose/arabinose dehydrogenase
MLLELGAGTGQWLISDLGGWTPGRGKIWRLDVAGDGKTTVTALFAGLSMPHTLTLGPDGNAYVGEMGRIFRFDPSSAHPEQSIEVIVDGLPDNRLHEDRHPLSHFAFERNHDLLVNVGAATDQCANARKSRGDTCAEDNIRGVVRRYAYLGEGRWSREFVVLAAGLRNSMVLLSHESGTLLQVENSYDFAPELDRPFEEINVLRKAAHYGWPYCWDMDQVTEAWSDSGAMNCAGPGHERPVALLPPHSAPLGGIYYNGAMFPRLRGKLLISLHGYRPSGARIVALDVDSSGIPIAANLAAPDIAGDFEVLTPTWNLQPGVRPMGAPVGLTVASDGALWLADDRNAAILRIAAEK